MTWSGGAPATATLRPSVDGAHQLRLPAGVRIRTIREGRQLIRPQSPAGGLPRLTVKAGRVYTIEFEPPKP
jgi:hypothetical protein